MPPILMFVFAAALAIGLFFLAAGDLVTLTTS